MKKSLYLSVGAWLLLLLTQTSLLHAQDSSEIDPIAPDRDYVWIDSYELDDGTIVKGFYRERARKGYTWVQGFYNDQDQWIENHWQSLDDRPGLIWVPGYVGADQYWVTGHWREKSRPGYDWVAPTLVAGVWVSGYWRPVVTRAGYVWVPGHRGTRGGWIPGHWRLITRAGYNWQRGYWRYGIWVPAFWKPLTVRHTHIWVGGYWRENTWVAGFWRPRVKSGFHWTAGYWGPRGWVVGSWKQGPRVKVVRKYSRVRLVDHMHRARAKFHRKINRSKQTAESQRQHNIGHQQERKGKKLENRGQAKGNHRMERKGKQLQKRGKKNQRKCRRKNCNKQR